MWRYNLGSYLVLYARFTSFNSGSMIRADWTAVYLLIWRWLDFFFSSVGVALDTSALDLRGPCKLTLTCYYCGYRLWASVGVNIYCSWSRVVLTLIVFIFWSPSFFYKDGRLCKNWLCDVFCFSMSLAAASARKVCALVIFGIIGSFLVGLCSGMVSDVGSSILPTMFSLSAPAKSPKPFF